MSGNQPQSDRWLLDLPSVEHPPHEGCSGHGPGQERKAAFPGVSAAIERAHPTVFATEPQACLPRSHHRLTRPRGSQCNHKRSIPSGCSHCESPLRVAPVAGFSHGDQGPMALAQRSDVTALVPVSSIGRSVTLSNRDIHLLHLNASAVLAVPHTWPAGSSPTPVRPGTLSSQPGVPGRRPSYRLEKARALGQRRAGRSENRSSAGDAPTLPTTETIRRD